jgi:hypothetical protein
MVVVDSYTLVGSALGFLFVFVALGLLILVFWMWAKTKEDPVVPRVTRVVTR